MFETILLFFYSVFFSGVEMRRFIRTVRFHLAAPHVTPLGNKESYLQQRLKQQQVGTTTKVETITG